MPYKDLCGFLSCIYFLEISNSAQLAEFANENNRNDISSAQHHKKRKLIKKSLQNRFHYANRNLNNECERFVAYFTQERYLNLPEDEKKEHKLYNCETCALHHKEQIDLRRGKGHATTPLPQNKTLSQVEAQSTPEQLESASGCTKFARDVIKSANAKLKETPHSIRIAGVISSTSSKRKASTAETVSKKAKREILKSARDDLKDQLKNKDFVALYSSTQSESEWDRQRKDSYGVESRQNREKTHIGTLDGYQYKLDKLLEIFDGSDLSTLNWSATSKEVDLRNGQGKWPKNGGQVLKKIAQSMGYDVSIKSRMRTAWLNYSGMRLNTERKTSASELKVIKQHMIESGEIEIGEMVVPIQYEVMKVKEDGSLEKTQHEVSGRKFSLANIRQDHLKRMDDLKLLRRLDTDKMSSTDISEFLSEHGESVLFAQDKQSNRERLVQLLHTRQMAIWHDHSDIAGASHYLFMVWFLYDKLTYYTDDEYKNTHPSAADAKVQTTVEAPYIYLLARSGSSVKDQLLYVPTRLDDIKELGVPVYTSDGRQYTDYLRYFSGDTPARQLEAGQQCGGAYPCICGMKDAKFHKSSGFNSRGPFTSLSERVTHLNKTATWRESFAAGSIVPFKVMKTDQLMDELVARGVSLNYNEKAPELRLKLSDELKGIRRPPAVLCSEYASDVVDIDNYEIAMTEPLHDFKNLINRIMGDLVNTTDSKELKTIITGILSNLNINNREMKGTECRLNLIRLTNLLQAHEDVANCKDICSMLVALVDLQRIAYSGESKRAPKMVLRAYNQSFVFALSYIALYKTSGTSPRQSSERALFGMPFHSLVVHLPEMLRLINGQAIVAEQAERHFNKIRQITLNTSNRKASDIITNCLFRIAIRRKKTQIACDYSEQANAIEKAMQSSMISRASASVYVGRNTIIQNGTFSKDHTAALTHLSRIADYIELGPGVWYTVHPTALEFFDGEEEPDFRPQGPPLAHFRSSNWKHISENLDKSWRDCLRQRSLLKIPLINELTEDPISSHLSKTSDVASTSGGLGVASTSKTALAAALEEVRGSINAAGSLKTSRAAGLGEVSGSTSVTRSKAKSRKPATDSTEGTSQSFISSVPLLHKEDTTKALCSSQEGQVTVEDEIRQFWPYDEKMLNRFFESRRKYYDKKCSMTRSNNKTSAQALKPFVTKLLADVKKKEQEAALNSLKSSKMLMLESPNTVLAKRIKVISKLLCQIQSAISS